MNLFEQFGYSVLLTYFSEVLLGRLELDPTLKLRNKPQPLYSVIVCGLCVVLAKLRSTKTIRSLHIISERFTQMNTHRTRSTHLSRRPGQVESRETISCVGAFIRVQTLKSKCQFSLLISYQYILIALHVFCATCHISSYCTTHRQSE